ncbi:MAG: DEAD/DEAH box helicase [Chloroflexi bacterium]|nr:DEAD/DEAH box helicase [Chloroflexota bacterium]
MLVTQARTFSDFPLHPMTQSAIAGMGITEPTPIQAQAIPIMLDGRDVIGQARTGSGKTLAFALPIVERCDPKVRGVQAMVLVPTRELAIQVGEVMGVLAASRRLQVTLLYGGRAYGPERAALSRGAQIVVGTPGRTLDHLKQGTLLLGNLRVFILDEGDEMLDKGFAPDVESILAKTPASRQTALFSATVADWVMGMAKRHLRNPQMVRVDNELESPAEIRHVVYNVQADAKLGALCTLLNDRGEGPVLVFGRTKHGVKKLAARLGEMGYPVSALQGNLSQNARERVMADFRSGAAPILVATNVAARGLDVSGIERVINFDLPDTAQLFTHRVGRTGRMGQEGEAITFVTPEESAKWRQIERELGRSLPRKTWPGTLAAAQGAVRTPPTAAREQPRQPQPPQPRGLFARTALRARPGLQRPASRMQGSVSPLVAGRARKDTR